MSYNVHIETIDLDDFDFSKRVLAAYPDGHDGDVVSTCIGSIDLSQMYGCWHPRYQGRMLKELVPRECDRGRVLGELKRGPERLACLHRNPGYYIEDTKKVPCWSFSWVGDRLYITTGMHRSVIGLYFLAANGLSTIVRGVEITQMTGPRQSLPVDNDQT